MADILQWAADQIAPPNAKLLLLILARQARQGGTCSCVIGYPALMEKSGLSATSIRKHLAWLRDHRFIVIEARFDERNGGRLANEYLINTGRATS